MQKIVIKNFGPIRDAEIEIKPITVLLGEQSTGKSTVAQLVHLSYLAIRDFFNEISQRRGSLTDSLAREILINTVQRLFYSYYGYNRANENFDVLFYYSEKAESYIRVIGQKEKVSVILGQGLDFVKIVEHFSIPSLGQQPNEGLIQFNIDLMVWDAEARVLLNQLFGETFNNVAKKLSFFEDIVFIPDGRNITVSFSETFKMFFSGNNFRLTNSTKMEPGFAQENIISNFILHAAKTKDKISAYGGHIEDVLESDAGASRLQSGEYVTYAFIRDFEKRSTSILKGKYLIANDVETIQVNKKRGILLNQASSGQRESIRIIQDLAVQCSSIKSYFRTIEEPEAHLFPSAQTALTELLVMTHNRTGSHFFLTTHSPYFLSSFNNLLYAAKAAGDNLLEREPPNPEHVRRVEALGYPRHLRLKANDFAAYQLKDGTAESIFNPAYAVTDIDGLDAVSFEIASKFEALVEIVKEAEAYETA